MKNKPLGKKLQTGQTVRILCFLCLALVLSGCPSVKHWDCMPKNAPQQLRYMLDEKDDMLMIPLILTEKVLLGTPFVTRYPFDDLRDRKFLSNQIALVTPSWGIGGGKKIIGFLLISSNGVIYDLDTEDMPDYPDSDIEFHRLIPDAAQQQMLKTMLLHPEKWNNSVREDFKFPSLKMLSPLCVTWQKPVEAKAVTVQFWNKIKFNNSSRQGKWEQFWKPFQEPDQYCKIHQLVPFAAEEVLFCHDKIDGYNRILCLNNNVRAATVREMELALQQAVKSGKYKLVAYEPSIPAGAVWDVERNRFLSSGNLRRFAKKNKLPLVILSRREKSENAPALPGIPAGVRQYWHCPECP